MSFLLSFFFTFAWTVHKRINRHTSSLPPRHHPFASHSLHHLCLDLAEEQMRLLLLLFWRWDQCRRWIDTHNFSFDTGNKLLLWALNGCFAKVVEDRRGCSFWLRRFGCFRSDGRLCSFTLMWWSPDWRLHPHFDSPVWAISVSLCRSGWTVWLDFGDFL